MKPELPWKRIKNRGQVIYKLYVSLWNRNDRYVVVFPHRSEFIFRNTFFAHASVTMRFPKNYYRKLESKKAYIETMLRLGVWDKLLEDV